MNLWLLLAFSVTGCALDHRPPRDRGASGLSENAPLIEAPAASRCVSKKLGCENARYLAETWVRRLSTGDQLCLEGDLLERPKGACLARAAVVDTAPDRVLVELREAKPGSKWFDKELHQTWFEEGALVDLALAEQGY